MSADRPASLAARIEAGWARPGPPPLVLRLVAALFGALGAFRRWLYHHGLRRTERLDVPVLVVGNRIVGGAGKTPTTLALCQALQAAGWRPGIVSRGHGGQARLPQPVRADSAAAQVGDEPLLLARRSGLPVWVGRDRAAAGRALRAAHPEVDLIVCDDGLQHLRLGRDVEVLVFDERGGGNGHLLPAGPLREPVELPARVPQIVLYNAAQPSTALAGFLARRELAGAVLLADWWQGRPATPAALQALRGRPLLACAGLGQPQRFFAALRQLGLQISELAPGDHHDYATLPWPAATPEVVLTEKDAIKLDPARLAAQVPQTRIWVVPLAFVPEPGFCAAVLRALPTR
ncbi:MAG: hypothetical protein RJA44_733 [Pseudomonadota bacterium]